MSGRDLIRTAPTLVAPTVQTSPPPPNAQPGNQYVYTPQQPAAATPNGPGSALRAPPTGNPYAPPEIVMRPMQGYQAPAQAVDYSYTPQNAPNRLIPSAPWATPNITNNFAGFSRFGGRGGFQQAPDAGSDI